MHIRWILGGAGCAALAALGVWLAAGRDTAHATQAPGAGRDTEAAAKALPSPERPAPQAPAAVDALLSSGLVAVFEKVLFEAQAPDKATLMARAPALLAKHLREDWRVRALGLLERYVDMQEALRAQQPPADDDPGYLRRALKMREALLRQYFRPEEVEGLFGEQMRHDNFMADKLEALANPALSPEQRATALEQSEQAWLSQAQREARKEAVAHDDAMRQTEALDARGASPQERFAARSETYGHEVARHLAALDQQNQEWNARLDHYASASEAEQAQLRETLFSEPERLRLSAALAMRAANAREQAGTKP